MLLSNSWVAESFSTTPRAPSCNASTICFFSAAAVSKMMRTAPAPLLVFKSRRASSPVWCGMARSRRRMSGLISVASFTASRPSQASPTTFMSGSASSSRRRPSRKIGGSSAMTMRMERPCLSIVRLSCRWDAYLHSSTVSRVRFYRECARKQAHSFADHCRPLPRYRQLRLGQPSRERKSSPIVLYCQLEIARPLRQPYQDVPCSAVLANIDQTLLHNARQFPAHLLRQLHFLNLADKFR